MALDYASYLNSNHTHSISRGIDYTKPYATVPMADGVYSHPNIRIPPEAIERAKTNLVDALNAQLYATPKENPMDTKTMISKIANERAAAKEEERIEAAFDEWEGALDGTESGAIVRLFVDYPGGKKTYEYVALFVDAKWYITGPTSPNGLTPNEFIAWLVERDITPDSVEWVA